MLSTACPRKNLSSAKLSHRSWRSTTHCRGARRYLLQYRARDWAGRGALTDLLATRAQNLIAVELDRALAPRLTEKWKSASHVAILQGDILELDLIRSAKRSRERRRCHGRRRNLPYYITSDILCTCLPRQVHSARRIGAWCRKKLRIDQLQLPGQVRTEFYSATAADARTCRETIHAVA